MTKTKRRNGKVRVARVARVARCRFFYDCLEGFFMIA